MADITRYDLDLDENGAKMAPIHNGDYVEYYEHKEIVDELQNQIKDYRKAVEEISNVLSGVI